VDGMTDASEGTAEMKVGELAERSGLTVRTLHHYDEIGLLTPARRTPAGHRLYDVDEVRRLQRIVSLRHLGLPLDEIGRCLDGDDYSLGRVLELQLRRIEEEMARQADLRERVRWLRDRMASDEEASLDDLLRTIQAVASYERYYTKSELDRLAERRKVVGEERIEEAQQEWRKLLQAFDAAREQGLEPSSPRVKALARTSAALIREFTGGDPEIHASLTRLYRDEGAEKVMADHDMPMSAGLWDYMGRARKALEEDDEGPAATDG